MKCRFYIITSILFWTFHASATKKEYNDFRLHVEFLDKGKGITDKPGAIKLQSEGHNVL